MSKFEFWQRAPKERLIDHRFTNGDWVPGEYVPRLHMPEVNPGDVYEMRVDDNLMFRVEIPELESDAV